MFAYTTVTKNTQGSFFYEDRNAHNELIAWDGPFVTFAYARYVSDDKQPPLDETEMLAVQKRSDDNEALWRRMEHWCWVHNMADHYRRWRANLLHNSLLQPRYKQHYCWR